MVKVCIIGAGVCGLSCAVRIKEKYPHFEVVIKSKEFSPNTTGDGAAGLWCPYLPGNTPEDKIIRWSKETYDFLHGLWKNNEGGVCLMPCVIISTAKLPKWRDFVFGFKELNENEVKGMHLKSNNLAFMFTTFTSEAIQLLPYLERRFVKLGGLIVREDIKSISNAVDQNYDIVINCSGLGARTLVPDDSMHAIRGQVARMKAPWMLHCVMNEDGDGCYVIPNMHNVVLGGTHQVDDYNTGINFEDTKYIMDSCCDMIPGLKNFNLEFEWAGLRPGRNETRVEKEIVFSKTGKKVNLIHNYGHGGSGITFSWGCAGEVLEIVDSLNMKPVSSKL